MPTGAIFEPLLLAAQKHRQALVEPLLFSALHADRDRFAALHAAFFTGGNFLYVPDGVVIEEPILRQHFSHEGGTYLVLPHTVIGAGRNSRFYYLDEYIGEEDGAGYRSGSAGDLRWRRRRRWLRVDPEMGS